MATINTTPKKILDKLDSGVTVTQPTTKTHNVYTFNEWLADNGTLKLLQGSVENDSETLYTVPTGKVFYLTSCNLNILNNSGAANGGSIRAGGIAILGITPINGTSLTNSASFPIPIKLTADQTVQIFSNALNTKTSGRAQGYEISA